LLPFHKALDGAKETALGVGLIGTTKQGIGPAYTDKAARTGLRWHDARDPKLFSDKLRRATEATNRALELLGCPPCDPEAVAAEVEPAVARLRPYIADTVALLNNAYRDGAHILLEGAQGAMLDVDFGTYPYVTSSSTTAGGCATGTGLPPAAITEVNGVLKLFTSRVGSGPFPTELAGELGERLRGTGSNQWDEFGTTTGRPRRCGWLDLVVGRYAARINGVTRLHLTKLDVLSELAEVKLCVGYRCGGDVTRDFPSDLERLGHCEPVYETFAGWGPIPANAATLADLPAGARRYVERVAEFLETPLASVSHGPGRGQTIAVA
jgi:adenylosuccinate synthase